MMSRKIIFKFDDYTGPTRRTRKLDGFVRRMHIKITWGVIGQTLEGWSDEEERWSQNALDSGLYFFWNHGWTHAHREFESLTSGEAQEHLEKTQAIMKQHLGLMPSVFGAPCNALNAETRLAVEAVRDLKCWYYGDSQYRGVCFDRVLELEYPLFNPSFVPFVRAYRKLDPTRNVIVLQGHPNHWTAFRRLNFYLIALFLRAVGCEFVFPTEV